MFICQLKPSLLLVSALIGAILSACSSTDMLLGMPTASCLVMPTGSARNACIQKTVKEAVNYKLKEAQKMAQDDAYKQALEAKRTGGKPRTVTRETQVTENDQTSTIKVTATPVAGKNGLKDCVRLGTTTTTSSSGTLTPVSTSYLRCTDAQGNAHEVQE